MDIGRRFLLVFYWVRFPTNSVSLNECYHVYNYFVFLQTLQIFIFFTIFLVQVYAQPYKKAWHNWLDSFLTAYIVILLSLRSTNVSLNLPRCIVKITSILLVHHQVIAAKCISRGYAT